MCKPLGAPFFFAKKDTHSLAAAPSIKVFLFAPMGFFVGESLRWGHESTDVESDPQRPTAGNKRIVLELSSEVSPRQGVGHVIREAPRRERDGSLHTSHKTVLRARQAIAALSECEGAVSRVP